MKTSDTDKIESVNTGTQQTKRKCSILHQLGFHFVTLSYEKLEGFLFGEVVLVLNLKSYLSKLMALHFTLYQNYYTCVLGLT